MADFAALATRYVLADEEDEQRWLAREAAQGIEKAQRKSTAVLSWAQSINVWMPGGQASGDDDSNVIARAKALGFLAATLETLDRDVLRVEQVEHLIAFFGAMFAIDHKAGILAAAMALRCLCAMSHFRPVMAAAVLSHMAKLGEDFRLQAAATRLVLYGLTARLVGDATVLQALQQAQGPSCSFLVDLLQLCRNERDPDNLLAWFGILRLVLERYDVLAPAVAEQVFQAVSNYFPISMRSSATPAGTTVDDLKTALRACFAASSPAAAAVLDFLLQKLDQGDALTVSVKVDILRTLHACITAFPRPAETVAPHAGRVWNALKYEVRHGDVPETIDWTLRVIQAVATRLEGATDGSTACKDFVELVLADSIHDLVSPTYAKAAGQLLTSAMRGGIRAYNLAIVSVLDSMKQNLHQAQLATYVRDLLAFLGDVLRTREEVLRDAKPGNADLEEFHSHDAAILQLLDDVYLAIWKDDKRQDPIVLAQIMNGLAELVGQRGPPKDEMASPLLCSPEQCLGIFAMLAPRVQYVLSSDDASPPANFEQLAHEAMLALKKATEAYPEGFAYLVDRMTASIKGAASKQLTAADLHGLRDSLARLAYLGCSILAPASSPDGRLCHLSMLTHSLDDALVVLLQQKSAFQLINTVLSGIYGSLLNIRDAFKSEGTEELKPAFAAYLKEATALVRQLYVRATANSADGLELSADFDGSALDEQDQYLHQLASMATFVIRDLDEDQQAEAELYNTPFHLFHDQPVDASALFHSRQGGRIDVLSLGILRGLRPVVMARLPGFPTGLLQDLDSVDSLPPRTHFIRNSIVTVVANKYSASTGGRLENAAIWKETVEAVKARLAAASLTPLQFARLVAVAAGAFARLDKDARSLAALLAAGPGRQESATAGEHMARMLGQLVAPSGDSLAADNHAVVKSIYKQWVYSQTVQPLMPLAFQRKETEEQQPSFSAAVAVLALIRHMPFSVYEDDVADVVRVLVAAATTLPSWADVHEALHVLQVVLESRPAALQSHLATLVSASLEVFGAARAAKTSAKAPTGRRLPAPPVCRKQALRLMALLPTKLEEGLLLSYAPKMSRALATACGDPVREIRAAAQAARESWRRVPV